MYGSAFDPAATSVAIASDAVNGPLIAFRNTAGNVWAKEGSLNAGWTEERAGGVTALAVASDTHNGPLIAVLDSTGNVWAKEGSLNAGWTEEWVGGVKALTVASDSGHGPLIAVLDSTGCGGCIRLWAKEGSLNAGWVEEDAYGYPWEPTALAVASEPRYGLLIATLWGDQVDVKIGGLDSGWLWWTVGVGNTALAVASDPVNGPLIAVVDSTGAVWAKEGGGWVLEKGP